MASKTRNNQEAPKKKKKRVLLKLFLLFVVLLIGVALFAQTGLAMRSIYLPMASKVLGTEVSASSGRVGFGGNVRLADLKVMGTDGKPALNVTGVNISVSPLSFLSGSPTVHHVRIDQPSLHVLVAQNGTTNLPQPPATEPAEKPEPKPDTKDKPTELPALNIGEIDIKNLTVNYADAEGNSIKIDPVSISFKNFKPGSEAPLDIAMTAHIDKPGQGIKQTVNLSVKGTVSEAADRKSIGWNQNVTVDAKGTLPTLTGEQTMNITTTAVGNMGLDGTLKNLLKLTAEAGGTRAADVIADIDWDTQGGSPTVDVMVQNVTHSFLNLVLAPFSPVSLATGNIDANIKGSGEDGNFGYDIAFNAVDMRALMDGQRSEPVTLNLRHDGNVALEEKLLTLNGLTVDLKQASEQLVKVSLDNPMKLLLTDAQAATANLAGERAVVTVTIADTNIASLTPWMKFAGSDAELPITAGMLGGTTKIDVVNLGKTVKVDGNFFMRDVAVSALDGRKLTIEKTYGLDFTDMNNLSIRSGAVELKTGGQLSGQVKATGNFDVAAKTGRFHFDTSLPRVIAMANDLGVIPPDLPITLGGGVVSGSHDLSLDLNSMKFDLKDQMGLKDLTIAKDPSAPLNLAWKLDRDLTVDLGAKQLDVRHFNINIFTSPAETPSGSITVAGKMPLEAPGVESAETGEMNIEIAQLKLAPYIRMANAMPSDATPDAVLNAKESIKRSKAGLFTLSTDVNLSVPPTARAAQSADPMDAETLLVTLKNEVTQIEAKAFEYTVSAISKFGGKQEDKFTGKGTAKLREITEIAFTGTLDSLVADPYLSRMKTLKGDQPAEPEADVDEPAAEDTGEEGESTPLPLIANADLTINKLKFRTTDFVDAHMTASYDRGSFSYKLDKGTLNGGSAFIDFNLKDDPVAALMNMAVKLDGVDMSRLAGMASPAVAKRFSGNAHVDLSADGKGKGKALMETLNGNIDFNLSEGHIRGIELLDFIAQRTGIESFLDVRFNKFGGKVDIENGWANLDSVKLLGPNHWFGFKGKVSTLGKVDLAISPGVSSSLSGKLGNNPLMAAVQKLESGHLRLPLNVNVKGEPGKYSITPGVNDMGLTSTVREQVLDRVMNADKTTSQVLGGVRRGLGEAGKLGSGAGKIGGDVGRGITEGLGGLLGGARRPAEPAATPQPATTETETRDPATTGTE